MEHTEQMHYYCVKSSSTYIKVVIEYIILLLPKNKIFLMYLTCLVEPLNSTDVAQVEFSKFKNLSAGMS